METNNTTTEHTFTAAAHPDAPTQLSSQAEVWFLKDISFNGRRVKIITQNFNGCVSFAPLLNMH